MTAPASPLPADPQARSSEPQALLQRIRILELAAHRNAAGELAGDYLTSIRGRGLIFHESRKYVPGEPSRSIDWNVTARMDEPYVKVNLEERQRDVFVALDVSPSMHSGFQERTKLEYAVELAATLAVSAISGGDRLGFALFADRVLAQGRPRGGRRQLFAVLKALLENVDEWREPVGVSDPRAAIHAIQAHRRGRFVVFLISDFIDHDVPEDLKYLQARHDVSLLHVFDPVEFAVGESVGGVSIGMGSAGSEPAGRAPVVFGAFSPERVTDGTRPRPIRPGATGGLGEMQAFLRAEAHKYGFALGSFSTALPVDRALGEFFHAKRKRLVR